MPVKNKEGAYEKIMSISKNNDYTTDNLSDNGYFSKHYKLIAIDLSKQIELENPDLRQQINFIGKLEDDKATMFFIIEKSEETTFEFLQILWVLYKMETQKIIKLLNDSSNEESKLLQKSGMSQIVKEQKVNTSKAILLNLKQKQLNQAFVIILMHLF